MIEECIVCRREPEGVEDKNAVAVAKDGFVVGHVPKCFIQLVDVDVSSIAEK